MFVLNFSYVFIHDIEYEHAKGFDKTHSLKSRTQNLWLKKIYYYSFEFECA